MTPAKQAIRGKRRVRTANRGKSPGFSSFYVAHRTAIDFPRGRITQEVAEEH